MCARMCVCVCVREREIERQREYVCKNQYAYYISVCVCVCVCVCVRVYVYLCSCLFLRPCELVSIEFGVSYMACSASLVLNCMYAVSLTSVCSPRPQVKMPLNFKTGIWSVRFPKFGSVRLLIDFFGKSVFFGCLTCPGFASVCPVFEYVSQYLNIRIDCRF